MSQKKVCVVCKSEENQSSFVMVYKCQAEKFLGILPSVAYCGACYKKKYGGNKNEL